MRAEDWLAGLDPIGWRFGLERIKALTEALGRPQLGYRTIHVVGTNGKSSVTSMIAALLEASGMRTGAYLSPHSERWAERVAVGGEEISAEAFQRAVELVAEVVPAVEQGFGEGERVTQFEAATAAAFVALRDAGVEVGVIEAGLGGRLDATNVLDSEVTVLTSIGLDHTQWLGETEREIAAEKLAVLREGTTLVLGDVSPKVAEQSRAHAAERGATVIEALSEDETFLTAPYRGHLGTFGTEAPYLRRNLAVAATAAEAFQGAPASDAVVERALGSLRLPGRFQFTDGDPPVIRDAAHNPDGARALAEAVRAEVREAPVVACIAVLGDKDAAGIVSALAPVVDRAVVCEIPAERLAGAGRPGTASVPAGELARLFEEHGVPAEPLGDPARARERAVELAKETSGVALIAGSHYLLRY